jgi:CheY-like chemotaxis protein
MSSLPKKKFTLIVDDDKIYVFGITKLIQIKSLTDQVEVKENGLLALDYLKELIDQNKALPDLILLDLNMPVLNGWEFLEEFSQLSSFINKNVSIYIVSSSIARSDLERSKTIEAVSGFLIKPIAIPDLIALFQ